MEIYSIFDVELFKFWEHMNTKFYDHNLKTFKLLCFEALAVFLVQ